VPVDDGHNLDGIPVTLLTVPEWRATYEGLCGGDRAHPAFAVVSGYSHTSA